MRLLYLLVLLSSLPAWAQLKTEITVEKTLPGLSEEEVKRSLLFAAGLKALGHFSSDFGMNVEEFQGKLSEKFNAHFLSYKQFKLEERFGKNHEKSLTPVEKKNFLESLDAYKDQEMVRFTRIENLIQTSTFRSLKKDEKAPDTWIGLIDLTLDKIKMDRFIKRISSTETKPYSRLWIITEFSPQGFSWSQLGLERETSFTNPISASWEKWVSENLPKDVEDVGLCSRDCLNFYSAWEKREESEPVGTARDDFKSGVFLKLSLDLRRTAYKESLRESTFEWSGRMVLIDINSKRVISTRELPTEKKQWRGTDQKTVNTYLATSIYRSPLSSLELMLRGLETEQRLNQVTKLVIKGYRNMSDVVAVMNLLKAKGSGIGLKLKIDQFSQSQSQLLCFYQGEEKSFTDLLSQLKELKSSESYTLINEHTGVDHVLRLVK